MNDAELRYVFVQWRRPLLVILFILLALLKLTGSDIASY